MIERKFKVGDRVKGYSNSGTVKLIDDTKDVLFQYYVKFDDDCWEWVKAEDLEPLLPAIPAGWTPASEPPDSDRNVRVVLKDGREWYGWYGDLKKLWHVYTKDASVKFITEYPKVYYAKIRDAAPGEVLAWREIEPDAKVDTGWYIVTDQLFKITHAEAVEFALELAKKGKVSYIARVVEEVKYHARG